MTDDEALDILAHCAKRGEYVAVTGDDDTDENDRPYFRKGSIVLRGDFFPEELQAILHFAPKEGRI